MTPSRSAPIVVVSPWPVWTTVSGGRVSSFDTILRSIVSQLLTLPPETIVHTGHGESTTIGAERSGVMERAAELGTVDSD